ncbi:MAG TPA: hypothetical protein VFM18_18580 [Methanosarcina sp.]|nr:hypothetical protein [Methanosarcina sp.]
MFLHELAEPQLLVIFPGRFQPFHKGHKAIYDYLVGKFGRQNVYIVTSNKVDPPRSPFDFGEKQYFMKLTGITDDRIIQSSQPYNIDSLLSSGRVNITNKANTVVIFAVSEKDMAEDPRFKSWTKKDGSPAYLQPLKDIKDTESMEQHGYIMTVPTFNFKVLGQPMQSGTELRQQYIDADEKTRQAIIKDLFGKYTAEAEQLMTSKLAPAAPIEAPRPNKLPKTATPAGGMVAEEGGVGVVKNSNDPRYVMSTTHDVSGNTLDKEMKALGLTGRKAPTTGQMRVKSGIGRGLKEEGNLAAIIQDLKDSIKPGMPAKYIDAIKQRIERLKANRNGLQ